MKTLSEEEIMSGSLLIEKFIGITCYYEPSLGTLMINVKAREDVYLSNWDKTLFHSSFDWIMPALRKFRDLKMESWEFQKRVEHINEALIENYDITQIFIAFVDVLKWYYRDVTS